MKRREDKRMISLEFSLPKLSFLDICLKKKPNTFNFGCMVIPLNSHSVYT